MARVSNQLNDIKEYIPSQGAVGLEASLTAESRPFGSAHIPKPPDLDEMDHVAITVRDIAAAVKWYTQHFNCVTKYQDATFAQIGFRNITLALVIEQQHPPHVGIPLRNAGDFGPMTVHRDKTESCYIYDPSQNAVEILATTSIASA